MADVFISYKREERSAVERLAQELRRLGLDVWFDSSLNAGEAFSDEIDRVAHAAKVIVVCWSPSARDSRWVKSEALIGFERGTLAACYVAGPDGFYPPTPFNSLQAEDLRAWLAAPSNTHAGWKSMLRRIGRLCARPDIESFGALYAATPTGDLRAWLTAHAQSPLFAVVEGLLSDRDAEESERARLEREGRERHVREEAERRAREPEARAQQSQHELQRVQERPGQTRAIRRFALVGLVGILLVIVALAWSSFGGLGDRDAIPAEVVVANEAAPPATTEPAPQVRPAPRTPERATGASAGAPNTNDRSSRAASPPTNASNRGAISLTPGSASSSTGSGAPANPEPVAESRPAAPGTVVFTQRPTPRQITELYPQSALRRGVGGRVQLECRVQHDLSLSCVIASETPGAMGFGRAALLASTSYRARATLSDGTSAVGANQRIQLNFQAPQ